MIFPFNSMNQMHFFFVKFNNNGDNVISDIILKQKFSEGESSNF